MVNFGPLAAETVSLVCTVLQQWATAKLCGVGQRAPPIFGRATITFGIGPHSSLILTFSVVLYGDGAGNTVEENSSVFSLIQMR